MISGDNSLLADSLEFIKKAIKSVPLCEESQQNSDVVKVATLLPLQVSTV